MRAEASLQYTKKEIFLSAPGFLPGPLQEDLLFPYSSQLNAFFFHPPFLYRIQVRAAPMSQETSSEM